MSSKKSSTSENSQFIERFIEACGTSQPVKVARLLNISYQASKNYLQGRLPEAKVLKTIAETTPYSLHWLLTGEGEKLVKPSQKTDTLVLTDQMRALIRQICLEVIGDVLNNQVDAQQKTVVLTPEKIKQEKSLENSTVFLEKEPE